MKFSSGAFSISLFLHIAGTALAPLIAFGTAMSAFNRSAKDVQQDLALLEGLGWIWAPGPMLLERVFRIPSHPFLYVCWSVIVALLVGYLFPLIHERSRAVRKAERLDPPTPGKYDY